MIPDYLVVFGAPDHEAELAKRLLSETFGLPYAQALFNGAPVTAAVAYKANGVDATCDKVALFECDGPVFAGLEVVIRFDHHRAGDPGFDKPPSSFISGSSIGQMLMHLMHAVPEFLSGRWYWRCADNADILSSIDEETIYTAAADHCLTAAYQGQCPGVEPLRLLEFRAKKIAEFRRMHVIDVLRNIHYAAEVLKSRKNDAGYADLSDFAPGELTQLPEAAAFTGIGFLAKSVPDRNKPGFEKWVLQSVSGGLVREFLDGQIGPADLVDRYGAPERGFAGGYRKVTRG